MTILCHFYENLQKLHRNLTPKWVYFYKRIFCIKTIQRFDLSEAPALDRPQLDWTATSLGPAHIDFLMVRTGVWLSKSTGTDCGDFIWSGLDWSKLGPVWVGCCRCRGEIGRNTVHVTRDYWIPKMISIF